jgi:anti-anti-sigma factor
MSTLSIEGELSIYRAGEWRESLQAALADGGDLTLDLAQVTEIDSAGVQLLMAAQKTAQATERRLHLVRPSAAVQEVFATLGLDAHFGGHADDTLRSAA